MSRGAVDKIAYAIHQSYLDVDFVPEFHRNRLARYEFGLSGHYGFTVGALRKFVHHALLYVLAFDFGNNKFVHKVCYKRRLARPHGSHYADIYIAVGALADVFINVKLFH